MKPIQTVESDNERKALEALVPPGNKTKIAANKTTAQPTTHPLSLSLPFLMLFTKANAALLDRIGAAEGVFRVPGEELAVTEYLAKPDSKSAAALSPHR